MESFILKKSFEAVKSAAPLIHNITNYVTVNDCANALLAIGASPIMSDEPQDVSDITSICGGLTINIGTLNERSIEAMHISAKRAAELGHPIVLDPVGAGASSLRTRVSGELLDAYPIAIVRGNMSEVKALAGGASTTRGVDVCPDDVVTDENWEASVQFALDFARRTQSIMAITGPIDIVADGNRAYLVRNGSVFQERITGAGCMLSCLCSAYAVAGTKDMLSATLSAVVSMGIAGQLAEKRMVGADGTGAFRSYLIDALYTMTGDSLERGAQVEVVIP